MPAFEKTSGYAAAPPAACAAALKSSTGPPAHVQPPAPPVALHAPKLPFACRSYVVTENALTADSFATIASIGQLLLVQYLRRCGVEAEEASKIGRQVD